MGQRFPVKKMFVQVDTSLNVLEVCNKMENGVMIEHHIISELAELHWKIARLEEMKRGSGGRVKQISDTEEERFHQSLSFQFFLRIK